MYDNLTNWLNIITSFHFKEVLSFAEIAASHSIFSENNIVLAKNNQSYKRYDDVYASISDVNPVVEYIIADYLDYDNENEFAPADAVLFAAPHIITLDNAYKIIAAMVRNFTHKSHNAVSHLIIILPMDIVSVSDWFNTETFYTLTFYSSVRDYKNSIDYHYIAIKYNDDWSIDPVNQTMF